MKPNHWSTVVSSLLLAAVTGVAPGDAPAAVVGVAPLTRPGYADFSQMHADHTFSPLTGHASWWGDPALPAECRMCGPATAAGAAFWFADRHGAAQRLAQVRVGADWVDATPGNIIEQFALAVGLYEGWDPRATPFPGTTDDRNYIRGQDDFYSTRGLRADFDYLHVSGSTFEGFFDRIVAALEGGRAVELSNTGHWFSIAGVRTDLFDDLNGNGAFDGADTWITDYDADGVFDRYLWVNNPWPGHASEGWESYDRGIGGWYLTDDTRRLDSAVFVALLPEPGTLALLLPAAGLVLMRRRPAGGNPP